MRSKVFVALAVVALGFFAIASSPALAAPGGGKGNAAGGGKPGGGTNSSRCTVTPNPVGVGGQYTIQGFGFTPGALINVQVKDPMGTMSFNPPVDSSGNFIVTSYAAWAGTSTVNVYDIGGRKMVFLTSCSFQVG